MVRRHSTAMVTLQVEGGKLLQHQDGGGGGGAKKMKRSGSMSTVGKQRHAGMPPETIPNYMKPTTCSDARKEQLLVSTRSPNSNCTHDGSDLHRKGTIPKLPIRSVRSSSSNSVRVLAKTPSLIPPTAKACSPVVLCENFDARRATCSSTLKDRKFPAYLEFDHGGNESEGTSAIRVCPYTYCSLNGFHHAPLPPLKCFLSAKRAAQRKINLGCGVKTAEDGLNFDRKVGMEDDLRSLRNGLNGKENRDWFVEILSVKGEKTDGRDEMAAEDRREPVREMVFDAPIGDDVCAGESEDKGMEANLVNSGFESGSGSSILGLETGNGAALFLGYTYESSSEIETEYGSKGETQIGHHEVVLDSSERGGCVGESTVDETLQELNDQGFDSDGESSGSVQSLVIMEDSASVENDEGFNSDGESSGSVQSLVTMECSASVEFPIQESEPVYDDTNQTLFGSEPTPEINLPVSRNVAEQEASFGNLENNLVEGSSSRTESSHEDQANNVENQDNPAENMEMSSIIFPTKQRIVHKAGNATEPETEGSITAFTRAKRKKTMQERDFITAFTRVKRNKTMQESDKLRTFNPREPNFLPLEPDPEAEKVDLRHQELDERKNREEWMVDYALRQEVTKLGPARQRKVALLVEAFEKVLPVTKCELPLGRASSAFDLARPIQACR